MALPTIRDSLDASPSNRQWVLSGYALMGANAIFNLLRRSDVLLLAVLHPTRDKQNRVT